MNELERLRKNVFNDLQEIERLNKIINELEKWLKTLITPKENWQGDITYNLGIRVDLILDKLKELKGGE